MVRMRSPVQIWLSAPRRTTSIADVVFFALHAKRLLRNLCVGCPLRTPPERPSAFRPIACCLQNNDRFVPKPLRFKCLRILPLFCVLYARLVKGRWLFVGFACCHLHQCHKSGVLFCVAVACVRLTQAQAFGSSRLAIISTGELGTSFFLRHTQNGCCATSA